MLLRRIHDTDGAPLANVNITDRNIRNSIGSGTCHSGVSFGSDGVLSKIQANGGFSAISGQWLVTGAASTFFVQRTILSGTLEVDPGTGFLQLNSTRTYDNQKSSAGEKITEVFFEVSSDVSGVPIVDTATMTFTSDQGFL